MKFLENSGQLSVHISVHIGRMENKCLTAILAVSVFNEWVGSIIVYPLSEQTKMYSYEFPDELLFKYNATSEEWLPGW